MTPATTTAAPRLSARAIILIELALALGGFAIGTGEFAIMGLMPNVAQDLGISEPQVGHDDVIRAGDGSFIGLAARF
jgi:DHA1 family inner membrane transport protein